MQQKLSQNKLIYWYLLFLMLVAQTDFAKWVVFFVVPLYIHLEFNKSSVNIVFIKSISILKAILVIGLFSGFLHLLEYDLYFFGRDILYFIQAPIFILLGIYLCRGFDDYKIILKSAVVTSIIISSYKLLELLINPALIFQLGLQTRYEYDLSNPTALLSFIILLYSRLLSVKLFNRNIEIFFMFICFLSVAISFSRTFYLLFIVLIIIYFFRKQERVLKLYWSLVISSLFIIFGGLLFNIESGTIEDNTFQSKVNHSLNEIVVKDYKTATEIVQNWRGYEAYLGLQKFYTGNLFEILFGQGFGSVVEMPKWVFFGQESTLSVIPMFHNGFITILLKTGLCGLTLFFILLYKILKVPSLIQNTQFNKQHKLITLLLRAIVFIILLQTLVVHGIFTTFVPFTSIILIGASVKTLINESLANRMLVGNSLYRKLSL